MSANSPSKVLFGFHAINVRLKTAPKSVIEIYHDATRRDARMRQFIAKASDMGMKLIESDNERLVKLAGGHGHQGVVAKVETVAQVHSLDELLENLRWMLNLPTLATAEEVTAELQKAVDAIKAGQTGAAAASFSLTAFLAGKDAEITATKAKLDLIIPGQLMQAGVARITPAATLRSPSVTASREGPTSQRLMK